MFVKHRKVLLAIQLFALALVVPVACKKADSPEKPSIATYATPDDAGNALLAAVQAGDMNGLVTIFGPDSKDIILSGDPVQDKNSASAFVAGYGRMHRWRNLVDGSQILLIGADNFPFPIPIKKNAEGKWFFDMAAGKDEVLNRRIGRNELATIDVCLAAAVAQAEYYATPHDGEKAKLFAAKFLSDPGKQNGLYWKTAEGQPPSPLGPLVAGATAEGYKKTDGPTPFHGYLFRPLKGQTDKAPGGAKEYMVDGKMSGGFAFVAYPAEYGNSGVVTFMINQDGVLLQKDLGKDTAATATAMTLFDPDPAWTIVVP